MDKVTFDLHKLFYKNSPSALGYFCLELYMKNVKKIKHYKYKRVKRGWIVVNCKTGNHSHMRSEYGCHLIINFLLNREIPKNEYLQESYRRLEDSKEKKLR